jgi:hypothetical protein
MRKEVRAWFGTWSDYRQEVEQMLDAGEDVVVVLRESGTGRGTVLRWTSASGRSSRFETS